MRCLMSCRQLLLCCGVAHRSGVGPGWGSALLTVRLPGAAAFTDPVAPEKHASITG